MGYISSADLGGMGVFSAANHAAAVAISRVGVADSPAMLAAAAGPMGPSYLPAYPPARANNLAATRLVAHVHAAIGVATLSSKAAIIVADNA
jgi:hypothetical protein